MKQLRGHSWYYYFVCVFAISFIVFYPVQWLLLQRPSWYPAAHRYRSLWARIVLATWFVRYRVYNGQYFQDKPVIICSNHSSYLDILTILAIFPKRTCFMAKSELSDIPLFGLFFKTIDIEVDRQSGEGGAKAYRKAVKALNENYNIVIFPEGGIHADPQQIKPFKEGAFQLAIRQKTDIIPVGLPDNYKILPDEAKIAKPGKIRIILHEPLQMPDITIKEIEGLKQSLFDIFTKRPEFMSIDLKTVERVAALAKLDFSTDEKARIQEDLNKIVAYFDKMNEIDTDGIEPLVFLSEEINVFRDDVPNLVISEQEALKNAPQKNSDYYKVPKVIERE